MQVCVVIKGNDHAPFDFDPYSNLKTNTMMQKMVYLHMLPLRRNAKSQVDAQSLTSLFAYLKRGMNPFQKNCTPKRGLVGWTNHLECERLSKSIWNPNRN